MTNTILEAQGIYKKFSLRGRDEELEILRGLDLSINKGMSIAIVGVSGSGKSTLLSLLAGLDVPDEGKMMIDGQDITAMKEAERSILRAQKMAFVFQDFMLLPHLSALENVILPLEMKGMKNAKELGLQELEKVGLGERSNHFPSQLSGGEQQRTALARAFVAKPLVLFADEPSGNLDGTTGQQIIELLFELNRNSNTTLVVVTHDMKLASKCDEIYELKNGRLSLSKAAGEDNLTEQESVKFQQAEEKTNSPQETHSEEIEIDEASADKNRDPAINQEDADHLDENDSNAGLG